MSDIVKRYIQDVLLKTAEVFGFVQPRRSEIRIARTSDTRLQQQLRTRR